MAALVTVDTVRHEAHKVEESILKWVIPGDDGLSQRGFGGSKSKKKSYR